MRTSPLARVRALPLRTTASISSLVLMSGALVAINGEAAVGLVQSAVVAKKATTAEQVQGAGAQLMQAAQDVADAQDRLDAASAKLPQVQKELDTANAASSAAKAAVEQAALVVLQAKAAVDAQQVRVDEANARLDEMHERVNGFIRQEYMTGGGISTEVEILLGSRDVGGFANQLEALQRTARDHTSALQGLAKAKLAQQKELKSLDSAKVAANNAQGAAQQHEQDAAAATDIAKEKQVAVTELIASRENELKSVESKRAQVGVLYQRLLNQQKVELAAAARAQRAAEAAAKKRAEADQSSGSNGSGSTPKPPSVPFVVGTGGYVSTYGAGRSSKAAIAWALSWVGRGREYHNLCLRFVDDAYAASHGRMPTAISMWQRAVKAGYGHPGDRNIPIGAQVFWQTSNPARHIGLYAGNGMVISTSAANGAVGFVPMTQINAWGPYLGWAAPYYP